MTLPICIIPANLEETYRGKWRDFDELVRRGIVAVATNPIQGQPQYEIARSKYQKLKDSEGISNLQQKGLLKVVDEAVA